jgi:hypothetical protein
MEILLSKRKRRKITEIEEATKRRILKLMGRNSLNTILRTEKLKPQIVTISSNNISVLLNLIFFIGFNN